MLELQVCVPVLNSKIYCCFNFYLVLENFIHLYHLFLMESSPPSPLLVLPRILTSFQTLCPLRLVCLFIETGSIYRTIAVPELTMWTTQALHSQRPCTHRGPPASAFWVLVSLVSVAHTWMGVDSSTGAWGTYLWPKRKMAGSSFFCSWQLLTDLYPGMGSWEHLPNPCWNF